MTVDGLNLIDDNNSKHIYELFSSYRENKITVKNAFIY